MNKKSEKQEMIRKALLDELEKQGKLTEYNISLVDDYVHYDMMKDELMKDIEKTGPRYTVEGTAGKMITKDNKSYGQAFNCTSVMLKILTKLDIEKSVVDEIETSEGYI